MGTTTSYELGSVWPQITQNGPPVSIIVQSDWGAKLHYGDMQPIPDTPDSILLNKSGESLTLNSTTSPIWARAAGSDKTLLVVIEG
ncbi:MAG: hypothetical protein V7776_21870 [Halopseudomonas aestusnigri]